MKLEPLTIRTFADYKRKTGISPLLANKDRGTSIRKTIVDYGPTKYSQVLPETTYYQGLYRPTINPIKAGESVSMYSLGGVPRPPLLKKVLEIRYMG